MAPNVLLKEEEVFIAQLHRRAQLLNQVIHERQKRRGQGLA